MKSTVRIQYHPSQDELKPSWLPSLRRYPILMLFGTLSANLSSRENCIPEFVFKINVTSSECNVVHRAFLLNLSEFCAMSSFSDSKPVFKDRCHAAGLSETITETVVNAGFDTLSKFAFSSSCVPGSGDDSAFIKTLRAVLSRDATLSELASFRKLLHEAYSCVTQEMKQQLERSEDVTARKLTQPERADLYQRQVKRLVGLVLKGPLEPSDNLVDTYCAMYEANRVRFIPWEKYTSKEAELDKDIRPDQMFAIDSNGKLKVENKQAAPTADTSTEILLQYALQRRGLAMDQSNLLEFTKHQAWVDRLIKTRLHIPPPGYNKPTFRQLLEADKKLFEVLADATRSGVQANAKGRPLDSEFEKAMNATERVVIQRMTRSHRAVVQIVLRLIVLPRKGKDEVKERASHWQ